MKFTIKKEPLLNTLQTLISVINKRSNNLVWSNFLLKLDSECLSITATDTEVEINSKIEKVEGKDGEITVSATKLLDICRSIQDNADLHVDISSATETEEITVSATLKSGTSKFILSTIPATDFPKIDASGLEVAFKTTEDKLLNLIGNTRFSMAKQDVRYYLNGLLIETDTKSLKGVATDGHRLALDEIKITSVNDNKNQLIIPRKGIAELTKLLSSEENKEIEMKFSKNYIQVDFGQTVFTSKLIEGKFPDYQRVIPELSNNLLIAETKALKQALMRVSILLDEQNPGVRLIASDNLLQIVSKNKNQEQAEEELKISYEGDKIEISFNVTYLLDVLACIQSEEITVGILDSNSSFLILPKDEETTCKYVIMPMKL